MEQYYLAESVVSSLPRVPQTQLTLVPERPGSGGSREGGSILVSLACIPEWKMGLFTACLLIPQLRGERQGNWHNFFGESAKKELLELQLCISFGLGLDF